MAASSYGRQTPRGSMLGRSEGESQKVKAFSFCKGQKFAELTEL